MSNNLGLTVLPVTETTPEEEARVAAWIDTPEYREKNFARQALVVNPVHACQPLGAELCAHGFEGTLPFVHGSQGCASYYRSTLNRHFREPAPAVSVAMTEDGAVFGGQNNLHEGLENAIALYKPKMIAVFTSCMPEVIGDDLTAFLKNARNKGIVPKELPTPYANTPSFKGTHVTGYDGMLHAILARPSPRARRWRGAAPASSTSSPASTPTPATTASTSGSARPSASRSPCWPTSPTIFDSPNDGTTGSYPGGTPLAEAGDSINGKATLTLQPHGTAKTWAWIKENFAGKHAALPMPMGIEKTDAFVMKLAELFDRPVPDAIKAERGRAVDAMTDAQQYMHGKKFAVYGDPDQLLGYVSFLLEMGATPRHVLCSRGSKKLEKELQALLETSPYGKGGQVWMNRDLWHLRSLLMTDPVDAIIGDTHGKFAARDAKIPLFRFGFPVFDRVNKHRSPIIGYQGVINMLTEICNKFIDIKDETCEERFFEMMR